VAFIWVCNYHLLNAILLLLTILLLLALLMLLKLGLSEALNFSNFESNSVCKFIVANPDWVAALTAGFILKYLIAFKQ
jgi:hypothetical protein